ncbi:MAG: hypothetical protein K2M75_00780 [Clostridia bacterium]|nr:hypothetical protein [Clostridia bacterium]
MALKCGNCRYFVKKPWFSSYCDFKHRMGERNDLASENWLACNYFVPNSDYDDDLANNGKTSDCFLTSACVEYLGKPDDCEELTMLRSFRDNYMSGISNAEQLIKEYYEIAPKIVKKINESQNKEAHYAYIYGVIQICLTLIKNGNNEGALSEYKSMVHKLKAKLLNI